MCDNKRPPIENWRSIWPWIGYVAPPAPIICDIVYVVNGNDANSDFWNKFPLMAEIVETLSKSARALQFLSRIGIKHCCICVFTVLILFTSVCLSERKSRTGAYPYCGRTLLDDWQTLEKWLILLHRWQTTFIAGHLGLNWQLVPQYKHWNWLSTGWYRCWFDCLWGLLISELE